MKYHIYFVTAILCYLAGAWLEEAASRLLCVMHLLLDVNFVCILTTGLHSSKTEALSVDLE
jgi:hypothetical protein